VRLRRSMGKQDRNNRVNRVPACAGSDLTYHRRPPGQTIGESSASTRFGNATVDSWREISTSLIDPEKANEKRTLVITPDYISYPNSERNCAQLMTIRRVALGPSHRQQLVF
jgi:hypothetical protein